MIVPEPLPEFAEARASTSSANGVLLPGFVGTTLPGWLAGRLRAGLAGVCLFGENISSPDQVRELTAAILEANPLAVIAIDEEGGDVTRLFYDTGSPYPGNAVLGRLGDLAYTERVAVSVGNQLRRVGCTMTFAPDADINSNPDNPVIGVRSFGADPDLVAAHTVAWIRGLQSTGIAASAKHFPGHGDTAQDSHHALPVVDLPLEDLLRRELVPFRAAIDAGTAAIMTSHILLPQLDAENPATLSAPILQGLLRQELGFDGLIVSDAIDMAGASGELGIPEAAARAIAAGCDLLCIGTDNSEAQLDEIEAAITDAVASGRLPGERLADAAARTRRLAVTTAGWRGAVPVPPDDARVFDVERTITAFDVKPTVRVEGEPYVVAMDTEANPAIGVVPWGMAAVRRVAEGGRLPSIPADSQLVLVGRDNHRHEWVRGLVDDARRQHPGVIVVDMGWPGDDRQYADVATFGASAHVSEALRHWLAARSVARTRGRTHHNEGEKNQ